ncbi:hypothetical protein M9458_000010, partial [Cirrhinus mrigala]
NPHIPRQRLGLPALPQTKLPCPRLHPLPQPGTTGCGPLKTPRTRGPLMEIFLGGGGYLLCFRPWLPELPDPPWHPRLYAPPWLPELPDPPWHSRLYALPWLPELPDPPWHSGLYAPPWLPELPDPPWHSGLYASPWLPKAPDPPWLPELPDPLWRRSSSPSCVCPALASRAPTPPPRCICYSARRTLREGGVLSHPCGLFCWFFPPVSLFGPSCSVSC